jgi:hypothetical protein
MNELIEKQFRENFTMASRLKDYCVGCLKACGVVAGTSGVLHFCQNEACIRYGLLTVFTTDAPRRESCEHGIQQGTTMAIAVKE